jgi:hypothetical protein
MYNKISKIILFMSILIVVLLQVRCAKPLPPQASCGFVQNAEGQRVGWNAHLPIKMYLDQSVPKEYYIAIQAAMNTWEAGIGHKIFEIAGTNSNFAPGQDGRNVIYWVSNWDNASVDQQANTTLYWVDNQITEADIRVDTKNFIYSFSDTPSSSEVDMESLMLHELGHVLGRKHEDNVPSVMAKSLADGILRRNLFAADLTDVKCEY